MQHGFVIHGNVKTDLVVKLLVGIFLCEFINKI